MSTPTRTGLCVDNLTASTAQGLIVAAGDVSLPPGSSLAITGGSGEERTALVRALGGLSAPTTGQVHLNGEPLRSRAGTTPTGVGYCSREHTLIGGLSAAENVALALLARKEPATKTWARAEQVLAALGLPQPAWHNLVEHLSGGQQQRVALARALAITPTLLILDDPTSELDTTSADLVWNVLEQAIREGAILIVATPDPQQATRCQHVLRLPKPTRG